MPNDCISKITLNGTTYDIKDPIARAGVTGVKGKTENSYRTGQVELALGNIVVVGNTAPGNVDTNLVPVGQFYIYIPQ